MPRRRMPWFKVYTSILNSSFNYEFTLEEQATFLKLIALAADMGGTGYIADGEGQSIPLEFIANRIHVPIEVLNNTIRKGEKTNRLKVNSTGLEIVKWKEYQSEYARQKPSREARKERDFIFSIEQNVFNDVYKKKKKELGRDPNGAEIAAMRENIAALTEEGMSESEIVAKLIEQEAQNG